MDVVGKGKEPIPPDDEEPPPPYSGLGGGPPLPPHGYPGAGYPQSPPEYQFCFPAPGVTGMAGMAGIQSPPASNQNLTGYPPVYSVQSQPAGVCSHDGGPAYMYPAPQGTNLDLSRPPQGYAAPSVVVTTQPDVSHPEREVRPVRGPTYLPLSLITCLCFCPLLGILPVFFSVLASSSYSSGNYMSGRRHAKTALVLSIFGIIISAIFMFVLFRALA